jgi:hypothetical protein
MNPIANAKVVTGEPNAAIRPVRINRPRGWNKTHDLRPSVDEEPPPAPEILP